MKPNKVKDQLRTERSLAKSLKDENKDWNYQAKKAVYTILNLEPKRYKLLSPKLKRHH